MNNPIHKADEKIYLALNGHHAEWADGFMLLASNLAMCIPFILLIAFTAVRYFKKEDHYYPVANSVLLVSILVAEVAICLYVLPQLFHIVGQRERPYLNPNLSSFARLIENHRSDCISTIYTKRTCLMFCITTFLFFTIKGDYRMIKMLLVIWCLVVSYSRVYVGSHYPLNVVSSNLIGFFLGWMGSRSYHYLKDKVLAI